MAKGSKPIATGETLDPLLDQLFSASLNTDPLKSQASTKPRYANQTSAETEDESAEDDLDTGESSDEDDSVPDGPAGPAGESKHIEAQETSSDEELASTSDDDEKSAKETRPAQKKRKRSDDPELEDRYLAKLARVSEADDRRKRRQNGDADVTIEASDSDQEGQDIDSNEGSEADFEIPKHETQDGSLKNNEMEQSNCTVFLGNVSSEAIKTKESKKELQAHLSSFFDEKAKPPQKLESLRFRSVAFATTSIPRKAAFAKKDLLDATTKSTNAYAVYSSPALAKTAVAKLNGTTVLDRHLRVDSVAHPSAVDHRRCVFVGNLGFVDDVSLMQDNGEEDDKKPKKKRQPGDAEEGLWRQFGKVGTVESVRVIRDKSTRVGKGFAYVQFTDQVAVEKALELNEKRFPPMLPRTLRVTRAKKITKTNSHQAKNRAGPGRAMDANKTYNPRVDPNEQSAKGRAGKLFGRAGAAQMRKGRKENTLAGTMKRPEDFVFEGHRAKGIEGKGTMNLKQKKKTGKPQNRSSKRGAAFKAAGGKKH